MGEPYAGIDPAIHLSVQFERMRAAARADPAPDHSVRSRRLVALEALVGDHADEIAAAISADFGHRSRDETRLLELFPSLEAVRHARRHLARWMRTQRRSVSLWFQPAAARVLPQPLGVVGIIVPWNYPVFLAVAPLVGALAAGNRVLLKMSEYTPATAGLLARLVASRFAADELAVVTGDARVGQAFAALPFDHLLFTGSTAVGHSIMAAAAENLTPVTLELGGKSPAIVGPDAPLEHAAQRIVLGKCLNAGQTCIAPDYVLLPAQRQEDFLAAARAAVARCYPRLATAADYSSIVNDRHFARLQACVEDARARGARVEELAPGVAADPLGRRLPPMALLDVHEDMRVMQEEIFGPLMPFVPYRSLDEAIAFVNARPRPLALYYFGRDRRDVERVLARTVSGGVTINDTILHIAQEELPFGGVGASGMGRYHGRAGFETFSHLKPVFRQSRINTIGLFNPPFGRRFDALVHLLLRGLPW